jgi:peptide/nickel transport system ATP-binding protein
MSEKLLEISGLSVCYEGEQILNNICFSVEKGETVGIAGESGSGKSTLLRAILRLMGKNGSITGGQITFRGEELTGMSEKKLRSLCGSEIGMIFQNTGASLCPTRKIGAQICESVRAHEKRCGFIPPISGGMSGRKSRREIKDMTLRRFADMGLSDGETIWNSYPSSLSGGMNQRVGIALAMLLHPSLLLADEPTGNLDPGNSMEIMKLLEEINNRGTTVLVVTHNREIVNSMKKRVITMRKGVVVSDEKEGEYHEV